MIYTLKSKSKHLILKRIQFFLTWFKISIKLIPICLKWLIAMISYNNLALEHPTQLCAKNFLVWKQRLMLNQGQNLSLTTIDYCGYTEVIYLQLIWLSWKWEVLIGNSCLWVIINYCHSSFYFLIFKSELICLIKCTGITNLPFLLKPVFSTNWPRNSLFASNFINMTNWESNNARYDNLTR